MIRFNNSKPTQIWYSEHDNGEAFTYAAAPKSGIRVRSSLLLPNPSSFFHPLLPLYTSNLTPNQPLSYSANGTHANWATVGTHDHAIPDVSFPGGPVQDTTDAGPIWDPVKAAYFYQVTFPSGTANGDSSSPSFTAYNGKDPTQWLDFRGAWGDDQLASGDKRQKDFFG